MRTIFVLFDSLNRSALGAYGSKAIKTPNFDRFAKRSLTFDTHYVGSLPCMPARRDMHTGRLNFMVRPWGPLEPFDNSFASILKNNGIYTHLISDHLHYFENGGWGYANSFESWDFIRGQENDPIKALVQPPIERLREKFDDSHYPMDGLVEGKTQTSGNTNTLEWKRSRHAINSLFLNDEKDYPTAKCFASAFEFLNFNKDADDWFLQLECFDPHEPFSSPPRFKEAYNTEYSGKILNWPLYEKVSNSAEEVAEIRANYAALVAMCDEYFGKLLDWMDVNDMWDTTCLVMTTDHGYLLGEHEWWAKNKMPYYEEISHIPLMVSHPEMGDQAGLRTSSLSQTVDLMPTFLDIYNVDIPPEVTATSLLPLIKGGVNERECAIFGMFAGPIAITDGQYSYFLFPDHVEDMGHHIYTLMPSHMTTLFTADELKTAEMVTPFDFTKGIPLMRIKMSESIGETGVDCVQNWQKGSVLFDLSTDPMQATPIEDSDIIFRLKTSIAEQLIAHDAPREIYAKYGLSSFNVGIST